MGVQKGMGIIELHHQRDKILKYESEMWPELEIQNHNSLGQHGGADNPDSEIEDVTDLSHFGTSDSGPARREPRSSSRLGGRSNSRLGSRTSSKRDSPTGDTK